MKHSSIRPYRRDDFDALATLYRRSKGDEFRFETGWPDRFPVMPLPSDETRLKAFSDAEALVVADEKAALAGVIYWQKRHIVGLLVDPQARGKGIGRALMAAALARMEGRITLDVVASNTPAIRLYDALYFQRDGQRTGFYQGVPVTLLTMGRDSIGRA